MKDFKAISINHMCKIGGEIFKVNPAMLMNPQPGDEEKWEQFMYWCTSGILNECENPLGEFIVHIFHQILNAVVGRVIGTEYTCDPKRGDYWFPEGRTIIASIEPIECPKCTRLMELTEVSKKQFPFNPLQRICMACGYSELADRPGEYKEVLE